MDEYKVLSFEIGRGSIFYRARKVSQDPFDTVTEMGCPPAPCTNAGRMNDPMEPIFYSATRMETALLELDAREGEHFQIMGVRVKPNHSIRLLSLGELCYLQRTGRLKSLGEDPQGGISAWLNNMGYEKGRLLVFIDAFFSEVLSDTSASDMDYVRSRILTRLAFEKSRAGGAFFPSVQDAYGMNLAIKVDAFNKNFHPVCMRHLKIVRRRRYGTFDWLIINDAKDIGEDGKIHWGKPEDSRYGNLFGLTLEEKQFLNHIGATNPNAMTLLSQFYQKMHGS